MSWKSPSRLYTADLSVWHSVESSESQISTQTQSHFTQQPADWSRLSYESANWKHMGASFPLKEVLQWTSRELYLSVGIIPVLNNNTATTTPTTTPTTKTPQLADVSQVHVLKLFELYWPFLWNWLKLSLYFQIHIQVLTLSTWMWNEDQDLIDTTVLVSYWPLGPSQVYAMVFGCFCTQNVFTNPEPHFKFGGIQSTRSKWGQKTHPQKLRSWIFFQNSNSLTSPLCTKYNVWPPFKKKKRRKPFEHVVERGLVAPAWPKKIWDRAEEKVLQLRRLHHRILPSS